MGVALLVLAISSPAGEFMVMLEISGSHDTSPWSGVHRGTLTMAVGFIRAVAAMMRGPKAAERAGSIAA